MKQNRILARLNKQSNNDVHAACSGIEDVIERITEALKDLDGPIEDLNENSYHSEVSGIKLAKQEIEKSLSILENQKLNLEQYFD